MIVVGEALVDLVEEDDGRLDPRLGGSARNLAIAAARLGGRVRYVGGLSSDRFGTRLRDDLVAEGVDVGLSPVVDAPTTLAVVTLDDAGLPTYSFHLEGTSALTLGAGQLAALPRDEPLHVSLGAVTLATPVLGDALLAALSAHPRLTSLDPNVRPAFVPDPVATAHRLAAAAAVCDLVKCSEEDLDVLHPGTDPVAVARSWVAGGAGAVVVTLGERGAVAVTADRTVEVGARPASVVDTVGAGDTFGAALLVGLAERGVTDGAALAALDTDGWRDVLGLAVAAAAVTVGRRGADPPRRAELG